MRCPRWAHHVGPVAAVLVLVLAVAVPGSLAWAEGAAVLRGAAEPTLHESVLHLEEYPVAGGGPVGLVFNVTYSAAASPGPAPVRLDVTGAEYGDLYRVHNITSNVGTGDPSVFRPYDYEAGDTMAVDGVTYTVRASIEVLAPGVVPVYARGLDGDIVTVHVAASEFDSMQYEEYLLSGQTYLDGAGGGGPTAADIARAVSDLLGARNALNGPPQHSPSVPKAAYVPAPSSNPSVPGDPTLSTAHLPHFDMHGTVVAEGYASGDSLIPVHGIRVCASANGEDSNSTFVLPTAAGEAACVFTGPGGSYRISDIVRYDQVDPSATHVFLVLHSVGPDDLEVTMADYYYYSESSPHYNVRSDIEHDFILRGEVAGAARIIDTMSDARAFFEPHGLPHGQLWVLWQHDAGASALPWSDTNGAAYGTILDDDHNVSHVIWLDGQTEATRDDSRFRYTPLHEFGHYAASLSGVLNDYNCPVHYIERKSTIGCAWGEGWAGFVPHMVDDRQVMPATDTIMYDIEAAAARPLTGDMRYYDSREPPLRNIGERVEGRVSAALWDMADAAIDPVHDHGGPGRPLAHDGMAVGYGPVVDAVLSAMHNSTSDFYSAWERTHYGNQSAETVMRLHNMSFTIPNIIKYYDFADSFGTGGTGDGQMRHPFGVDVTPDGTVLVADMANSRVQAFDADGNYLRQFGANGSGGGSLGLPIDVAANATHVLVADAFDGRIAVFDMADGMPVDAPASYGSYVAYG